MAARGERVRDADRQNGKVLAGALGSLPARARNALFRLYVLGEDEARICADLGLTPAALRRARALARAKFEEIGPSRAD